MHHMFDETPNDKVKISSFIPTTAHSDAIYDTHIGKIMTDKEESYKEQVDTSQYR